MSATAHACVDGLDLGTLAGERWFGDKGRSPRSATALGAVEVEGGALVIADIGFDDGPPARYSLITGQPWTGLAAAAGAPCSPGETVRPLGLDQSHTSVVIGERILLKVYRRLAAGLLPEPELTGALTRAGWTGTPVLLGSLTWTDPAGDPWTVAVAHAFAAGAQDGYELLAEALARRLADGDGAPPGVLVDAAQALGTRTAELHELLALLLGSREERCDAAALRAGAVAELDAAIAVLPATAAREVAALAPQIADVLQRSLPADAGVRRQRIHGDLHLGQTLRTELGWLLVDFEGDPLRDAAARRVPALPEEDLASLLRSLDHVVRSAARRAGAGEHETVEAWIATARSAVLRAYRDRGGVVQAGLLRVVELRKELAELRYAATRLPSWLWAPLAGLPALLALPPDPEEP